MQRDLVDRARTNWFKTYPDIILMILSIVQGLAFQDLALRAPELLSNFKRDPLVVLHLGLCFVILLRVFQTYLAVALDYEASFVSFTDFMQIFAVGLLEYAIFASLGRPFALSPEPFLAARFHIYLAALLAIACVKYAYNCRLIDPNKFASQEDAKRERRLQLENAVGSGILALFSLFSALHPEQWLLYSTTIAATLVLILQMLNSLRKTFGLRAFVRQDWHIISSTAQPNSGGMASVARSDMSVRDASVSDATRIAELSEPIRPELSELFGVSRHKMRSRILDVFSAGHGKEGLFGWQRWRVVTDNQNRCLAAYLYYNDLDKSQFIAHLESSIRAIDGELAGAADRAAGCGFIRSFEEDKSFLACLLLTDRNTDSAAAIDAIVDADYVYRLSNTQRQGLVFRTRHSDWIASAIQDLTSRPQLLGNAIRIEAYHGIGWLDSEIGDQALMLRITRI